MGLLLFDLLSIIDAVLLTLYLDCLRRFEIEEFWFVIGFNFFLLNFKFFNFADTYKFEEFISRFGNGSLRDVGDCLLSDDEKISKSLDNKP